MVPGQIWPAVYSGKFQWHAGLPVCLLFMAAFRVCWQVSSWDGDCVSPKERDDCPLQEKPDELCILMG